MDHAKPFGPLAPGAIDTFAFDFAFEAMDVPLVAASWEVRMRPYQPGNGYSSGIGPPQPQYIVSTSLSTIITTPSPLLGQPSTLTTGQFALAEIGGFPPSVAGSWFVIGATVTLTDGRTLSSSGNLLVSW